MSSASSEMWSDGYYLMHLWRGKVEFPELKRQVLGLADAWKPHVLLVEDKASGQSLIQELQRDSRLPVHPVQVDRDKISRAHAVTPLVEAGKVFLPRSAVWLSDFIEELATFPKGSHDDQFDSMTQALNYMCRGGGYTGLLDYYQQLADEAKQGQEGVA